MAEKKSKEQQAKEFLAALKKTCPPDLFKLLEKEGSVSAAARASGMGANTITYTARGEGPLGFKAQNKLDLYLAGNPVGRMPRVGGNVLSEAPEDNKPPVVIPPWDKKYETVKITKTDGTKQSFKMPALIAQLFAKHGNVKNTVGKALGYSGWNTVSDQITKGFYETKLHERAYRALNGLPLSNGARRAGGLLDDNSMTLRIAICIVNLNDYERLEEIANVMGGKIVTKTSMGSAGWVVVYRIADREKLAAFASLARRDAKKIVCP